MKLHHIVGKVYPMNRLLWGLLFIICSCNDSAVYSEDKVHPKTTLIPYADSASVISSDSVNLDSKYVTFLDRIELRKTIGERAGSGDEIFGEILSVISDEEANIYLLDGSKNEVKMFDKAGRYVDKFGQRGSGPSDLYYPKSMYWSDDLIFILDNYYVKILGRVNDSLYVKDIMNVDVQADDICVMGDSIYLKGVDYSLSRSDSSIFSTLFKYSLHSKDLIDKFGSSYGSAIPFINYRISSGYITCNNSTETVVFAFQHIPYIYGYSEDGKLKWVSKVMGFKPIRHLETDVSGSIGVKRLKPEDQANEIINLVSTSDKWVIMQQINRDASATNLFQSRPRIQTYLLDSSTGRGGIVNGDFEFISHLSDSLMYSFDMVPFPRFSIYDF